MDKMNYYAEPECSGDSSEDERFNEMLKASYSPEYWEKAKVLGDFIKGLPLTVKDNDKLIELMLEHLKSSTSETFYIAFELGIKTALSQTDDTQEIKH